MTHVLENALFIWHSGGHVMLPLFALSLFIFYTAAQLFLFIQTAEKKISIDIDKKPEDLIQSLNTSDNILSYFQILRSNYFPFIRRRSVFLASLITIAPLSGLLGTVAGMLTTFEGMTIQVNESLGLISKGISEALISTQTGLIIAIPGYILLYWIQKKRKTLLLLIARYESKILNNYEKAHRRGSH